MRHPILLLALAVLTGAADAQLVRISLADDGSEANAGSYRAAISSDGSVIAFHSNADNLVAADSNGWTDVFVANDTISRRVAL